MTHLPQKKKLDELLRGAVDLRPQPDFAAWRQKHPEAIEALRAIPTIIAKRRSTMIRIVRYSTSAAAAALLLIAGAWWMLFSHGVEKSWAAVIDQLATIRTATCNVRVHRGGFDEVSKVYLEGARVRLEFSGRIGIMDFQQEKVLEIEPSSKKAVIRNIKKDAGGLIVLGGNPLDDLIKMKDAPAERLPDEKIDDTLCQVYRVKDTTFLGFKVPWVKLWLDPKTGLPVQLHSVIADGQMAWTFTDFRWNEPFDKNLMQLVVPEGYKLEQFPGGEDEKTSKAKAAGSPRAASEKVGSPQGGASTQEGREIPTDEIAKTLDMFAERIEANYKAMTTWSGTYDLVERSAAGDPSMSDTQRVSHVALEFFAEPVRDRIRINYREIEPPRLTGEAYGTPVSLESRWVRTPEQLLRFPLSDLRSDVEGFPNIEGLRPGQRFRVLYREPPKAGRQYGYQGFIDPLSFFGDGSQPYWKFCSTCAGALRGEHGPDNTEYAKKNMALRERQTGSGTEYVLIERFKPVDSDNLLEVVFSSAAGLNVVSQKFVMQGRPDQTQEYTFRKEEGVFIPFEYEFKRYDGRRAKDSDRQPTQDRVFTLTKTEVNGPIDPAVFEIPSLGLQRGDRLADWIEHRMEVFDGKQFLPADRFKPLPGPPRKGPMGPTSPEAQRRNQSINNMKQIALAMHVYHDAKHTFPPAYTVGKDGKPLLSWRVLILPVLECGALYKEFHLDEPWDSEHNKKLIARMPEVYKSPKSKVSGEGRTNYLTVRGPQSVFSGAKGISFGDIPDGTSNTIMTVEVSDNKAVIWTKPDDFEYDQQDPLKGLVGLWPDGFIAGLADGSVWFVSSTIDPTVLNAFFTRNGGEKVDRQALGK